MLEINIPGWKSLRLSHLVLDFNGTIACDGRIIVGVKNRIDDLSKSVKVHVITADTFGSVREQLLGTACRLSVIANNDQAEAKLIYVRQLGAEETACIGNGRNDRLMLKEAALGIAVVQTEGASIEALLASDVATCNILDALDLLTHPLRLVAALRS